MRTGRPVTLNAGSLEQISHALIRLNIRGHAIEKLRDEFWPKLPITAYMTPGASDATYLRNAGIPTYGFSAVVTDITDVRDHGRDERVLVTAFYGAHEALYKLVKDLASPEPANEK